jgi:hypothetical protein
MVFELIGWIALRRRFHFPHHDRSSVCTSVQRHALRHVNMLNLGLELLCDAVNEGLQSRLNHFVAAHCQTGTEVHCSPGNNKMDSTSCDSEHEVHCPGTASLAA